MIAFNQPWQIVGLIALVAALRVALSRMGWLRGLRAPLLEFDDSLLIAFLVVFCLLRPFVLQSFYIPSESMEPTLQVGDRILVLKWWYRLRPPRPGEIMVFRAPRAALTGPLLPRPGLPAPKDLIKRLVGAPGDRLRVMQSAVYRNGRRQEEPYLASPPDYSWPLDPVEELRARPEQAEYVLKPSWFEQPRRYRPEEVVVPPRQRVVMGDNRNNSNDSHAWRLPARGHTLIDAPFVPEDAVLGRAWLIFWPLERVRVLR